MSFETIFTVIVFPLILIIYIVAILKLKEHFQPWAKGVRKKLALKWYLQAFWFNGVLNKHRFCCECGWELTYIDDLYDFPIESLPPNIIAECPNPKCLTQYEEYEGFAGRKTILSIKKSASS